MKLKLCHRFLPHLIASTYPLLRWTLEREKAPQRTMVCESMNNASMPVAAIQEKSLQSYCQDPSGSHFTASVSSSGNPFVRRRTSP